MEIDMTTSPASASSAEAAAEAITKAGGATPGHFLPHLQGLRAIAVLLVVIYHFWPGRLQGGYVGVDVFFVISGFLITSQLARELERSGRIRLPNFYARRVRRLLPASALVLVFSALATLFLLPLSSLATNLREILASTFYVENWALALGSVDYLGAANEPSLVQHYWSLSLEEQFYLMWPLVLIGATALGVWLARRRGKDASRWKALVTVVAVASILSFVFSVIYTQTHPAEAYFNTFTRVWEFGVGGLLALLPRWRPRKAWLSNVIGYAGIIAIVAAGYLFTKSTVFPGWAALLPVLGTAAVIVAHHRSKPWDAARVLSVKPLTFIGDISYSLYLWHWPLIIIAPYVPGWGLSTWNRIALFLFCFLLAWLTKKFVEDPTRSWTYLTARKPRVTFGWMLGAMAVTSALVLAVFVVQQPKYEAAASELQATLASMPACFGAASGPTNGLEPIPDCVNPELADQIIPSPGFGNADRPVHPECLTTLNDARLNTCEFGDTTSATAPRVAVIGDSHAYALLDPIIQLAEKNGWHLTTYLKGGCVWSTNPLPTAGAFADSCAEWRAALSAELDTVRPYDAIFTAALTDRPAIGSAVATAETAGFTAAWAQALGAGSPIVTVVDNPVWEDDPNKCLRVSEESACAEPRSAGLAGADPQADAAREAVAAGQDVTLLDFSATYCGPIDCLPVIGGANVYRDQDHLTRTFAFTLAPFLEVPLASAIARAQALAK
jgi:peptidoglycan/LPS O-acetylase OafA/YrhL